MLRPKLSAVTATSLDTASGIATNSATLVSKSTNVVTAVDQSPACHATKSITVIIATGPANAPKPYPHHPILPKEISPTPPVPEVTSAM